MAAPDAPGDLPVHRPQMLGFAGGLNVREHPAHIQPDQWSDALNAVATERRLKRINGRVRVNQLAIPRSSVRFWGRGRGQGYLQPAVVINQKRNPSTLDSAYKLTNRWTVEIVIYLEENLTPVSAGATEVQIAGHSRDLASDTSNFFLYTKANGSNYELRFKVTTNNGASVYDFLVFNDTSPLWKVQKRVALCFRRQEGTAGNNDIRVTVDGDVANDFVIGTIPNAQNNDQVFDDILFGHHYKTPDANSFRGRLAEFRLWDTDISDAQVANYWDQPLDFTDTSINRINLVEYVQFNDGDGPSLVSLQGKFASDQSTNPVLPSRVTLLPSRPIRETPRIVLPGLVAGTGYRLVLQGHGAYGRIPTNEAFHEAFFRASGSPGQWNTGQMTFEWVCRWESTPSKGLAGAYKFHIRDTNLDKTLFEVTMNATGVVNVFFLDDTQNLVQANTNAFLQVPEFVQTTITMVVNRLTSQPTFDFYKNGVKVGGTTTWAAGRRIYEGTAAADLTDLIVGADERDIGTGNWTITQHYNTTRMEIGEIRLWTELLFGKDILARHNRELTPDEITTFGHQGHFLAMYYPCDEPSADFCNNQVDLLGQGPMLLENINLDPQERARPPDFHGGLVSTPGEGTPTGLFWYQRINQDSDIDEILAVQNGVLYRLLGDAPSTVWQAIGWAGGKHSRNTAFLKGTGRVWIFGGETRNRVYDGRHLFDLGIDPPAEVPEVENTGAGNVPEGVHDYIYTFYNSTWGIESNPSPAATLDTTGGGTDTKNRVSRDPTAGPANADAVDPQVDSIRIYRTKTGVPGIYFFLAQIPVRGGASAANEWTYDDDSTDAALGTAANTTLLQHFKFPACRFGAFYDGRLWLGGDWDRPDSTYFSEAGLPFDWKGFTIGERTIAAVEQEEGPDETIGFFMLRGNLYCAKQTSIHRLDGTGPSTYKWNPVIPRIGAVSFQSVKVIGEYAYLVSNKGVYRFDTLDVDEVGWEIQPIIKAIPKDDLALTVAEHWRERNWYVFSVPGHGSWAFDYVRALREQRNVWMPLSWDPSALAPFQDSAGILRLLSGDTNGFVYFTDAGSADGPYLPWRNVARIEQYIESSGKGFIQVETTIDGPTNWTIPGAATDGLRDMVVRIRKKRPRVDMDLAIQTNNADTIQTYLGFTATFGFIPKPGDEVWIAPLDAYAEGKWLSVESIHRDKRWWQLDPVFNPLPSIEQEAVVRVYTSADRFVDPVASALVRPVDRHGALQAIEIGDRSRYAKVRIEGSRPDTGFDLVGLSLGFQDTGPR